MPFQVWLLILEEVKVAKDMDNLARASPVFQEFLEPRRVEYLFPAVFPILIVRQQKIDMDFDFDDLRLVCSSWRDGVGTLVTEHPSRYKLDTVTTASLRFEPGDNNNLWGDNSDSDCDSVFADEDSTDHIELPYFQPEDSDTVEDFMETFEDVPSTQNPMFHRMLVINDPSRSNVSKEEVRSLWTSITAFLEKFGEHIWFCELALQNNIKGFSYYYKVREWLELMPNLQVLFWKYPIRWEDFEEAPETPEFGSDIPIFLKCRLEDQIRENGLPKLEKLKVFKTDDLPYPIFREFIQKNEHIQRLQFHRKYPPTPNFQQWYDYGLATAKLKNITELSVVLWTKEEIKELEASSKNSKWPQLKKLSIFWAETNYDFNDGLEKCTSLLNFLQQNCFAKSLQNLTLRLPHYIVPANKLLGPEPSSALGLLGPVSRVKIIMPEENESLDFLLFLKESVQQLQVDLQCTKTGCMWIRFHLHRIRAQLIELTGYHNRMYASNIWKQLPKLETLLVKKHYNNQNHQSYRYHKQSQNANL